MTLSSQTSVDCRDPRHFPNYSVSEAAHYLRVPTSTLRAWALGQRPAFKAVFEIAQRKPPTLSFFNLVEGHVLSAIREHIPMPRIRSVLEYVESRLGVPRPLVAQKFQTDGVNLFVDHYGRLLNVSQKGQLAMRQVLDQYLSRIDFDDTGQAARLYPLTRERANQVEPLPLPKAVVFDPWVSFGRLTIVGTGVTTMVVADRFAAGDSIDDLMSDFDLERALVEEAIRCEGLKRAA